jgi:hypothetical protein
VKNQLVYQLPDSYAKPVRGREEATATNTWRLLSLSESRQDEFSEEAESVEKSIDIDTCSGYALDAIGEMYGCIRELSEDDETYRRKLFLRLADMFRGVSVNEILAVTELLSGAESGDIYFKELGNATVSINVKSPEAYKKLTLTDSELLEIVKGLLPVGVKLEDEVRVHEKAIFLTKDGASLITSNGETFNSRDW